MPISRSSTSRITCTSPTTSASTTAAPSSSAGAWSWTTAGWCTGLEAGRVGAMLSALTLEQFTERLAAGTPTPGGGSAAALAGSLSASLIEMVCGLTIGREAYRGHEATLVVIRDRAATLRRELLAMVDRDAAAYDAVIAALRMPKKSATEQSTRKEALGRA